MLTVDAAWKREGELLFPRTAHFGLRGGHPCLVINQPCVQSIAKLVSLRTSARIGKFCAEMEQGGSYLLGNRMGDNASRGHANLCCSPTEPLRLVVESERSWVNFFLFCVQSSGVPTPKDVKNYDETDRSARNGSRSWGGRPRYLRARIPARSRVATFGSYPTQISPPGGRRGPADASFFGRTWRRDPY